MKNLIIVLLIFFACGITFSQTWQAMGVPPGRGVTGLVYWSGGGAVFGNKLWASTSSYNWPTGQWGGVYYSAISGSYQGVWYQVSGGYVARTVEVGQDGNLYASIWSDPAFQVADALCRFAPQVGVFGPLYQASSGDNVFSIAVKNNPHIIFGGTRNGIIRSTDNGTTFGYSNTGIPDSSWVFDIAIDSTGIIAAASSNGLFISTNNGDSWKQAGGIAVGDTIKQLLFYNEITLDGGRSVLMSGSENGYLYTSTDDQLYLNCAIIYSFGSGEVADVGFLGLISLNEKKHGVCTFSRNSVERIFGNEGSFYLSSDNGLSWMQEENGLPPNPPVTALEFKITSSSSAQLYVGLFNDTTNGAGVYKMDIVVDVDETNNQIPTEFNLEQNYPNPFNPSTTIQFSIPEQTFVKIEVFNALGEKISTLVSEELNAGNYSISFNASSHSGNDRNMTSGIYFYQIKAGYFNETKKMTLLK